MRKHLHLFSKITKFAKSYVDVGHYAKSLPRSLKARQNKSTMPSLSINKKIN